MEEEKELDLKAVYAIIKKKLWLIVIITLLAGLISVINSIYITSPTYKSETGILIGRQNTEKVSDQDVALYQIYYETYKDVALSNEVAQKAAAKLENGTNADDLLSRAEITAKTGTMIINVSVNSKTAEGAYKDTKAYAEAFIERAKELKLSGGNIEIIEKAQIPSSPLNPGVKHNAVKALFLGFLIAVLISFLLEFKNKKSITKIA